MGRGGYIKLFRSLLEWSWHDDPATLSVFIHLLLLANFADSQWRGVALKPGQVAIGRKALAELTGLSERQVRTALTRLKSTGCVTIEATNKYSLISFVNWGKFQGLDDEATSKTTSNATNERPANDHYIRNKECLRKEEVGAPAPSAKRFSPPVVADVAAYCAERKNGVDAQQFVDFYTAKGWRVGNSPMKDWRASVRTWERRDTSSSGQAGRKESDPYANYEHF